ncbi:Dephospho-CoA kinase [Methylophaga frappieri]|uniref:Dephospho-CoA kinase n=1 Tax=Methylophaga frappieri (strain ATCC BAA-2434 / DSM 25690 / JAM7) TaxID=754477 RepID=I1YKB8_METFJ|nr:dephospho-CoA kinase [Methylophaga frappieri]AFJ03361.1 Dephospho-CoA kinase [Methylophaga frappieri]
MLRVGLTGGAASGKSTVCKLLAEGGAKIIDADRLAKELSAPDQPAWRSILQTFGNQYALDDGQLDRKALRELIFTDEAARSKLEQILHPPIRKAIIAQMHNATADLVVIAVPLLIEAQMQDLFDRILVITADDKVKQQRLQQRDAISPQLARQILNAQIDEQRRLHYADDIIDNNHSQHALASQVEMLLKVYRQHCHFNKPAQ